MVQNDRPLVFSGVSVAIVIIIECIGIWVPHKTITSYWPDAAGWAAIGTLILAGFAIAQWRLSALTARRQLRAYLSVSGFRIHFTSRLVAYCEANLKNNGQTPAYFIADRYDVFFADDTEPTIGLLDDFDGTKQFRASVGPGEETTLWAEVNLDEAERTSFEKGALKIWFLGEIKYQDAFGDKQYVMFKTYADESDLAEPNRNRMNISDNGNEQS
jgi:hypothetical protein